MVTQILNADPKAVQTVQLPTTQVLPQILPTLNIGDVVRMSVRQNDLPGQGLLYLKGQLITANLPEFLKTGDRLLAKIDNVGQQIIFQLLDIQSKTSEASKAPVADLARKLQTFITEQTKLNFQLNEPVSVKENLRAVEINNIPLAKVLDFLVATPKASEAERTVNLISKLLDGSLSRELREVSNAIKQFIQTAVPSSFERFVSILKSEISTILTQPTFNSGRLLENLINIGKEEIANNKQFTPAQKVALNIVIQELRTALVQPNQTEQHLNSALNQLQQSLNSVTEKGQIFTAKNIADLGQLATRFEQLANSVDVLNQLNPVMQALGEPALILFPFLFHGLLSHSQITIDSNAHRKQQQGEEGQDDDANKKHYQHIQVTLALPSLGDVAVDIAHREKEIFVRFTVTDNDIGEFLLEQLEHLAPILREQGFEKAELVANVGPITQEPPPWALAIQSSRSIVV